MIISLEMTGETPIYTQLRNQIIRGIGRGEIGIGERLPSVRRLAQDAGINSMTVNKAYQILKSEGFIEIDRRRGAVAAPVRTRNADSRFLERLADELELLAAEACLQGVGEESFLDLCGQMYRRMNPRDAEQRNGAAERSRDGKRRGAGS